MTDILHTRNKTFDFRWLLVRYLNRVDMVLKQEGSLEAVHLGALVEVDPWVLHSNFTLKHWILHQALETALKLIDWYARYIARRA